MCDASAYAGGSNQARPQHRAASVHDRLKERQRRRKMAHTKVLLREDVDDLGARGEIVRERAGYARNYLLPRNLAVEATAGNVKGIEAERAALKEAKERATAEGQA